MMRSRILFLAIFLFSTAMAYSQMTPIDLSTKLVNSSLVVEGKVLSKTSSWDNAHQNIYTTNLIEVYKVFKGALNPGAKNTSTVITVITKGGEVGLDMEVVTPSMKLRVGDVGVFTLKSNSASLPNLSNAYMPFSGKQGFYKYDKITRVAANPFETYTDIAQGLHKTIENINGYPYAVEKVFDETQYFIPLNAPKTLTSFAPSAVSAGTETTITINGTGFGTTQGTVNFANGDDGGATFIPALDDQVVSWSNTQIVVEVPSDAGTGLVQVVDAGSGVHTSSSTLTVDYSILNVVSNALGTGDVAYRTQHVDDNGSGGMTFQYFTDFAANTGAASEFGAAATDWSDETCINWEIGANTTVDVTASDAINIARFDNGSELASGTLGQCTSYYSGCFSGGTLVWYVSELDMTYDDGVNWNFAGTPSFTEFDFESVTIHELGHGHQLGHVINPSFVMHFSLANGSVNNVLSAGEIAGANDVMARSLAAPACGQGIMTEHVNCCDAADVPTFTGTTSICNGSSTTLTIVGNLNDDTSWEVYTVSCGGTTEASITGTSFTVSPTTTTTYFVRGEGGCTAGLCGSVTVTVNSDPDVSTTSSSDETCAGNDGTATVTPSGGSGSFNVLWDAGAGNQTTPTATGLAAGTYTVVVTDASTGCDATTNVTVIDGCGCVSPTIPALSPSTPIICNDGSSATITITGTLNDATAWEVYTVSCGGTVETSTAGTSFIVSPTTTTTYFVRGEGGCVLPGGCSSITITVNDLPNLSATSSTDVSCAGGDGTATVNPTGGSGTYNIAWNAAAGNQITPTATGLAVGTYNVVVSDATFGCSESTNVAVVSGCVVPNTRLSNTWCGSTPASLNTNFYANGVSGATLYEFSFVNVADPTDTYSNTRPNNANRFTYAGISSVGATYDVQVRANVGGTWGTFATVCQISTSSVVAKTRLSNSWCGKTVNSYNTNFYAVGVTSATEYTFEFSDAVTGAFILEHVRPNTAERLTWAGLTTTGTTYNVRVKALVGGVYGAYSKVCTITAPSTPALLLDDSIDALDSDLSFNDDIEDLKDETLNTKQDLSVPIQLEVKVYPNPNNGQFNVEIEQYEDCIVKLYNMDGRLIQSAPVQSNTHRIQVQSVETGMYLLEVFNGKSRTLVKVLIK